MKNTRYFHLGRILLSDNSKKLVIHGTTWMNVKSFILSERNQIQNISIDYVCSIYRKSENRFLKIYIDRKSGLGMGERNCLERDMKEPFDSDSCVLYFVFNVCCIGICSVKTHCTEHLRSIFLLYVSFTSIKNDTHTQVVSFSSASF